MFTSKVGRPGVVFFLYAVATSPFCLFRERLKHLRKHPHIMVRQPQAQVYHLNLETNSQFFKYEKIILKALYLQ